MDVPPFGDSGVIPGIKVDMGAKPQPGFPKEQITEGLDGLRERLQVRVLAMWGSACVWNSLCLVCHALGSNFLVGVLQAWRTLRQVASRH